MLCVLGNRPEIITNWGFHFPDHPVRTTEKVTFIQEEGSNSDL